MARAGRLVVVMGVLLAMHGGGALPLAELEPPQKILVSSSAAVAAAAFAKSYATAKGKAALAVAKANVEYALDAYAAKTGKPPPPKLVPIKLSPAQKKPSFWKSGQLPAWYAASIRNASYTCWKPDYKYEPLPRVARAPYHKETHPPLYGAEKGSTACCPASHGPTVLTRLPELHERCSPDCSSCGFEARCPDDPTYYPIPASACRGTDESPFSIMAFLYIIQRMPFYATKGLKKDVVKAKRLAKKNVRRRFAHGVMHVDPYAKVLPPKPLTVRRHYWQKAHEELRIAQELERKHRQAMEQKRAEDARKPMPPRPPLQPPPPSARGKGRHPPLPPRPGPRLVPYPYARQKEIALAADADAKSEAYAAAYALAWAEVQASRDVKARSADKLQAESDAAKLRKLAKLYRLEEGIPADSYTRSLAPMYDDRPVTYVTISDARAAYRAPALADALSGAGPVTAFAPTDAALRRFARALGIKDEWQLARIATGEVGGDDVLRAYVRGVLLRHVACGSIDARDLGYGRIVSALGGKVVVSGDDVLAEGDACNGRALVVDEVLTPPVAR